MLAEPLWALRILFLEPAPDAAEPAHGARAPVRKILVDVPGASERAPRTSELLKPRNLLLGQRPDTPCPAT